MHNDAAFARECSFKQSNFDDFQEVLVTERHGKRVHGSTKFIKTCRPSAKKHRRLSSKTAYLQSPDQQHRNQTPLNQFFYTTQRLERRILTPYKLYTSHPFHPHLSHLTPFTPNNFYTKHLLHQTPFTPNNSYTRNLLQETPFTQTFDTRHLYTKQLLHKATFQPDTLYTPHFLHHTPFTSESFCTRHFFAPETLYTKQLLHQTPFAPDTLLHETPFAPQTS